MFVTTSICMTSRASFITGQYARRHRIWDFEIPLTPEQLADLRDLRLLTAKPIMYVCNVDEAGSQGNEYVDRVREKAERLGGVRGTVVLEAASEEERAAVADLALQRPVAVVEQFRLSLLAEVNFGLEAANLAAFTANSESRNCSDRKSG